MNHTHIMIALAIIIVLVGILGVTAPALAAESCRGGYCTTEPTLLLVCAWPLVRGVERYSICTRHAPTQ